MEVLKNDLEQEKKWCVYMHISPSGKRYIGITSADLPESRWRNNGSGYLGKNSDGTYSQPAMAGAINKYKNWEEWQHYILLFGEQKYYAEKAERALIKHYKCQDPLYGYNISPGGDAPMLGRTVSEETKQKISEHHVDVSGENNPMYGKHHSDETKKKIISNRNTPSGENHPLYGKHLTEETKEKLRKSGSMRKHTLESKQKISERNRGVNHNGIKPVYCVEMDQLFYGVTHAEKELGIDHHRIAKCCKGQLSYAGKHHLTHEKLHWMYAIESIKQEIIIQERLDDFINNLKLQNEGDN